MNIGEVLSLEAPEQEKRSAVFSTDRVYRYTLEIIWNDKLPLCQVVGLNPSTADEVNDDPTIRRVKAFARREGCGGIVMTNLFALRATNPKEMLRHPRPVGEVSDDDRIGINDVHLVTVSSRCALHIAAWGKDGKHRHRSATVVKLFKLNGRSLKCFGTTANGEPLHPLYLAANRPLVDYL